MKERIKQVTNNDKGFTLMEMIIVVAIIAILVALIAPNLTGFLQSATDTSKKANAKSAYTAANAWVVQERIAGHTITNGTITATSAGVTSTNIGRLSDSTVKANFEKMLDCGTYGDGSLTITIEGGTVTKVVWKADASDEGTSYPEK